jgi:LPXTG-motif cell wall-anchored protein
MNRKSLTVTVLICLAALMFALPVAAGYTQVTGQLYIAGTSDPWVHGATIYAYRNTCSGDTIGTGNAGSDGAFMFSIANVNSPDICIVVDFTGGPVGDPPNQQATFPNGDGTLDAGVFEAFSGPNAVSLQGVSAGAVAASPALLAVGMALLGGLSLVVARRKQA